MENSTMYHVENFNQMISPVMDEKPKKYSRKFQFHMMLKHVKTNKIQSIADERNMQGRWKRSG